MPRVWEGRPEDSEGAGLGVRVSVHTGDRLAALGSPMHRHDEEPRDDPGGEVVSKVPEGKCSDLSMKLHFEIGTAFALY